MLLFIQAFRNQTQRAVGGGGGRIKEFEQLSNGWNKREIDKKLKDKHIEDLVHMDLRATAAEHKADEEAEKGADASKEGAAASSASASTPKKTYTKNRPPYCKNDPAAGGPAQPFTIRELEYFFSAETEIIYKARITCASKVIEDNGQAATDMLPFGIRLHRRQGAGARTNPGDGLPGFISKAGLTVYHVTNVEVDKTGRIVSLCGVGRNGEHTKAYVWA